MPYYRGTDVSKRDRYVALRGALWAERSTFDAHWMDLADHFMPRRTRFWAGDKNRGDKRNHKIIDSTGRYAAKTLSSGLHAGLTSPARPWLKLTTPDPKLAELPAVKNWLHVVTQRMMTIFATSNLYNVLPLTYLDMGIFGTSAMSMVQDNRDLFRCYSYPCGSFALGQDRRGTTSTFVRDYELTVRQVVEEFGVEPDGRTIDWTTISSTVKRQWEAGNYESPVQVTWMVKPNEYADRTRLASRYLPFTSCHWELASDEPKFLRESGFKTFPLMTPRWDITGEDNYGTDSPGMTTLGDVRQLQIMHRRKGQAISKMVDPPLVGPPSLRTQKTSLLPGDITYVDVREGMQSLKAIHEVNLNIEHLRGDIRDVQFQVERGFYADLFQMMARLDEQRGAQPMTAREVDERHEEKLIILGPVLERTNDELLDPIVDRGYSLMEDNGLLPQPPAELDQVALKIEYISILSQAQKMIGVAAQDRFLTSVANLAPIFPHVTKKVKIFQAVDNYAEMLGVDPRLLEDTDTVEAQVAAEAKEAQAAMQAKQAVDVTKATKQAAETPMGGDTALSKLLAAAGGGAGQALPEGAPGVM